MSNLLEQASLVMIPSGYKEDVVYSEIPLDGSGDLQLTRASDGTRINSQGLVEVVPWNLLQYSEDFSNSYWQKTTGCTITTNNASNPINGQITADTLNYDGTGVSASYRLYGDAIPVSVLGQTYTWSGWFKSSTPITMRMYLNFGAYQTINITNEWQRFTVTATGNGVGAVQTLLYSNSGDNSSFSIDIFGWQVNIGSTAKPYFPTTDRLNVPRLTYQNGGGGCPSLLLEKQSTNIVTYSEQFDNAAWLKYQCSISVNQTTSPDGTQNADKLTISGGTGTYTGLLYRTITPGANSIFMKNDSIGNGKFYIQVDGIGNARWNTDGTLVSVNGGTATNGENMGNGWFRFTYVCSGGAYINYGIENGTTGDSIFIWGAQVEASSYPTSYIPTTSSSATRVADACSKTGISSLIGQTEGVIFLDFEIQTTNQDMVVMNIYNQSSPIDGIYFYVTGSNQLQAYVDNPTPLVTITSGVLAQGRYRAALAYKLNDFAFYLNGSLVGVDSSGTVPTCNALRLENYANTQTYQEKTQVYQCAIFPTRLTNAELASLTTI